MIEIKNIVKTAGEKVILDDISLTIESGSFVVLIGPSGCGKTTTLKLLNKLIEPTSGEIYIDGKPISKEDPIKLRRNIGYVIQNIGLFPHLTIKENIELIPKLKGDKSEEEISETTERLIKMVGLDPDEFLYKYPTELSGGQQQRIGVIRAIATDADIILMDEPFSALDPVTRSDLQDAVVNLQKQFKKTIVFVTHDMDEAIKLADKICIIQKGWIVQYDTPENILKNPANEYVQNFVGKNRLWSNSEFIKASDIMLKNPCKISVDRTIIQALQVMNHAHVDSVLVTEDNKFLGIVWLADLQNFDSYSGSLKNFISDDYHVVYENTSLKEITNAVDYIHFGIVPVLDLKNELVGYLTKSRLLSVLSRQYQDSVRQKDGILA